MTGFYGEHSKVFVSVDCIVFGFDNGKLKLLIGKRQMDPGRGEWSLYGGFVGEDESLEEELRTLSHAEDIKEGLLQSGELLDADDGGVIDRLRQAEKNISSLVSVFPKADELAERMVRHQYATYRGYSPHTIWEAYSPTEPKPATCKVNVGGEDKLVRPEPSTVTQASASSPWPTAPSSM